ncbi:MAG: 4-hydroxybutyrate CoA-transferase [Chloroflexi bacterium]|nr:4-hydroxybutyrate CoA-transferase [Chloroflexota bacterium]MCY3589371.1 4-hydroxybutyrate CoA-transferase [Chloroflexota bacterium]MCY3686928.1 4-hydroxybutyrate CoA-transferase [Chloroflexota bacterium]MDE2709280.1 4-hydroxybutyrate CoA-transferase [Chloroflexota bacterium]
MTTMDFDAYLPPRSAPSLSREGSPEQALRQIPDGARVVVPPMSATPVGLLHALDEIRDGWTDIEIATGNLFTHVAPLDHPGQPFRFSTYQTSGPLREVESAGALEHIPATYAQVPSLFRPDGPMPADAILIQVSESGPEGMYSLGTSVGGIVDVVRTAPLVIAQVNPNLPYTFGAAELQPEEIDWVVPLESDVLELRRADPGPLEREIAESVAELVTDGATLQFGIGGVPEAIMGMLGDRRDLGIHSGLISDGVMGMVESGALTGSRKSTAPGLIITTEAAGSAEFFHWIDRNPAVCMAPAGYTHALEVLARQHNFVGINSAVQVALDGTINAESLGPRQISGPGGQPDFASGAMLNGGVSVVAMPSTAARGKVSRIVRRLDSDAVVTTPRTLADRIITEFGQAELAGRTLGARTEALREIAHPDFRDQLT